jgi:hypothetical protein
MSLSPEMNECITTGCCPKCSRAILTKEGTDAGVAGRKSCAERLLGAPPIQEAGLRVGFFGWLPYLFDLWASRWAPQKPTAYTSFKSSPGARRASKTAERLFLVDVPREAVPQMVCKLCYQSWPVGK